MRAVEAVIAFHASHHLPIILPAVEVEVQVGEAIAEILETMAVL
jgi:hypothetical protein